MTTLNPDITYIDQLKDFIQKHVSNRATTLIEKLQTGEGNHSKALEGILYRDNWVTPAIEDGWEVLEAAGCYLFWNAESKLTFDVENNKVIESALNEWDNECYQENAPTEEDWYLLCENQGIDCYTEEPLEYWIVSDWLAIFLEKSGEIVSSDVYGLCVWGRDGGELHMDNAIRQIYQDQVRG